jgi:hypothetical protein
MDIFKLIFEHDLRLEQLRERHLDRSTPEVSASIEDFLKPDPTYSKFYITGTLLDEPFFGLNRLDKFDDVVEAIGKALDEYTLYGGGEVTTLKRAIDEIEIGRAMIFTKKEEMNWNTEKLQIQTDSNIGHFKSDIAEVLEADDLVLYKENAHHGYDLHLFSKENIYPKLFNPLRELVNTNFRFFSVNGKRVKSERTFYFETWTLSRPPHGAEEVFKNTKL